MASNFPPDWNATSNFGSYQGVTFHLSEAPDIVVCDRCNDSHYEDGVDPESGLCVHCQVDAKYAWIDPQAEPPLDESNWYEGLVEPETAYEGKDFL